MSRRYMSTRFDERNCHAQCVACNIFNQGNSPSYRKSLVLKYGENSVNIIESKARVCVRKFTDWDYEQLIKYYSKEVDRIKKEKHL